MKALPTPLPPLLLTSCVIVTDQSVALKDQDARIRHTLESIAKWLEICPDLRIVLCDGSNFDFTTLVNRQFPHASIECLAFRNNAEMVRRYGKGYGEGEIVLHALQHSAFIKDAGYFAKCTAKLWVENFMECLPRWNGRFVCKGHFAHVFSFRRTVFEYVDTRFYLATRDFYLERLASAHLFAGGEHQQSIEDSFRKAIETERLSGVLFDVQPVICGVGGGTGTYYKNSAKRRLKDRLRLWLVRHTPTFRALFV